ncbi:MAG TPA: FtsX-like permease family protein, partial [Acidimicrobiales bacterium]|nr:FtsX-like permease family protein [Acidimicrobiales bacterium]
KRLGDTISVDIPDAKPTRLTIVGTATMPVIGGQFGQLHSTMGTGAIVPIGLIPTADFNPNAVQPAGPSAILVRLRPGANTASSLRALERIAGKLTLPMNYGVTLLPVQRPAEIINYRSMGTIPAYLGLGLATGAVIALGLTLVASVRRRRHDLAVLKTLGFTGRELAFTVMWQSSIATGIGTIVGVPLGIVLGRALWDAFAHEINAVPSPSVPVLTVALIAIGALVLANVVAVIPGRTAARTPTALLLRAE